MEIGQDWRCGAPTQSAHRSAEVTGTPDLRPWGKPRVLSLLWHNQVLSSLLPPQCKAVLPQTRYGTLAPTETGREPRRCQQFREPCPASANNQPGRLGKPRGSRKPETRVETPSNSGPFLKQSYQYIYIYKSLSRAIERECLYKLKHPNVKPILLWIAFIITTEKKLYVNKCECKQVK